MSSRRYRPKRRLRSEIFPLFAILSLPVALYLVFPSGAVGYSPEELPPRTSAVNAFVTLGAARESKLLASARSSWQSDAASRRGVRANLLTCGSDAEIPRVAAGLVPEVPERVGEVTDYEVNPIPAGVAAGSPPVLPAEKSVEKEPAFSQSDLLKLD